MDEKYSWFTQSGSRNRHNNYHASKRWPGVHIQRYDLIVMLSDEARYHILEDVSYGILKTRLKLEWHFLQMFSFNSSLPTTDLFCFRKKGVLWVRFLSETQPLSLLKEHAPIDSRHTTKTFIIWELFSCAHISCEAKGFQPQHYLTYRLWTINCPAVANHLSCLFFCHK